MTFDPPLNTGAPFLSRSKVRHNTTLSSCVGPNLTQHGVTITGGTQRTVGRPGTVATNCSAPLVLSNNYTLTGTGPDAKMRTTWIHTGTNRIRTVSTALNNKVTWTWADGSPSFPSLSATDSYSSAGVTRVRGSFRRSIGSSTESHDWPAFRSSLQGSLTLGQVQARCSSLDPTLHIASETYAGTITMP